MNIKTITLKLVVMLVIVSISYLILIFTLLFYVDYNETNNAYRIKKTLLQKSVSPKIILIGGSNVLYGIDSEKIEKIYGRPVINMAINANIGLRFMLESIKPYLGRNDIIIISPEYEQFYGSAFYGKQALINNLTDSIEDFKYIDSLKSRFQVLIYCQALIMSRVNKLIYGKQAFLYNGYNLNEFGDIVFDKTNTKNKVFAYKSISEGKHINNDVISYLVSYEAYASNRSVKAIFSFPFIPSDYYDINIKSIEQVYEILSANNLKVLSHPKEFTAPSYYFYDTVYHLNAFGRAKRTDLIIKELKLSSN